MAKSPIPEDWQEFIGELAGEPLFIDAWKYAEERGNKGVPKACYAFADAHWQDFAPGRVYGPPLEETAESIQDEINRLMAKLERRATP